MSAELVSVRTSVYAPLALAEVPRLLGLLDREPASPTYGSFDRDHWSWKFRDFPLVMPQWAVYALALLWKLALPESPWRGSTRLLEWTRAALAELCKRQRPDGAFDSVGPNSRDYGATLASIYYLAETARVLGSALPAGEQARVRLAIERAARSAETNTEDYAFIANHHALYALGLRSAAAWLNQPSLEARAGAMVAEILSRQSVDGFYEEYGGNDPGYETLGIYYLARYWELTGDARVLASLERAVDYYSHALQLDGSAGGAIGSRHTRLYFPGGFEILAGVLPMASAIADYQRARLSRGEVVSLANVDAQNLYVVLLSTLHACAAVQEALAPAPLPCRALRGVRRFSNGLVVAGRERYYAVAALHKGATLRVHSRESEALVYEDAGYLVRSRGRLYASQINGLSQPKELGDRAERQATQARLGRVRLVVVTPLSFLLLRIANLTLFRSPALGRLIRRWIVSQLVTANEPGPFSLEREIRFGEDEIEVSDVLRAEPGARADSCELTRAFTAVHMGSARYFHSSELSETPLPDTRHVAQRLSRGLPAGVRFSLRFGRCEATLESLGSE
jgi:hypothetical protein